MNLERFLRKGKISPFYLTYIEGSRKILRRLRGIESMNKTIKAIGKTRKNKKIKVPANIYNPLNMKTIGIDIIARTCSILYCNRPFWTICLTLTCRFKIDL